MKSKTIHYIGVDVGGTKILAQAFDESLKILAEKKVPTEVGHDKSGFLKQLYSLIDMFFGKGVRGIGVALPGIVDYRKGILVKAPHLPVGRNLKLRSLLEKKYGVKVHIDHDINAFMAAEYQRADLSKFQNLLAVMIGPGVGGAAIINGELYYGKSGFAGEFGHIVIDQKGFLKTFEQKTSGHHLPLIAKTLGIRNVHLWKGPYFAKKLEDKSKEALLLKKTLTENLGVGLANLNLIFNPEAIVLGGSIYHKFLADQKKELQKIIARHSLDNQAPALFDPHPKTSLAKGAVLLLKQKRP